ncbi:MAG: serine hydrolase domain-containing protein [Halanaerobiales bacterium]
MKSKFKVLLMTIFISFIPFFFLQVMANENVINWNITDFEGTYNTGHYFDVMEQRIKDDNYGFTNINSIITIHRGQLAFESYYNGYNQDTLFDIRSVTKTITSALIGIATDKGFIGDVNDKVIDYLPEYVDEINDSRFKELTIKHLLTMTDGMDWKEEYFNSEEVQRYPVRTAFRLSFKNEPGEEFRYSSLNSHLLSAIINKATGMSELEFANKYLFGPLNIKEISWAEDYQGINTGGFGLQLRTRDMVKIGQLYYNKGIWDSQQIISSDWINESTEPHVSVSNNINYGYHIWTDNFSYFARGYGGQLIMIIPDFEIVIAITSSTDQVKDNENQLISDYIIPAFINYDKIKD